jgi:1-acyl-sn-glycerol-3-phosphate acyltransferase
MAFIMAMCIALPLTLLPQHLLYKLKLISKIREEQWALATGEFCARWLLRLIPFCKIQCIPCIEENPEPAVWVCNHTSALDVFLILASDLKLRGKRKRPIKVIYVSCFYTFSR